MLFSLIACGPPEIGEWTAARDDSVVDSQPADQVPGVADGLCRLELACAEAIQDEPKTACTLRVQDAAGTVFYDGPAAAETRGRSSASFPKKQYGVELRGPDDQAVDADLLGMGGESDWVLNGAYIDRAFVRNKLGYDLFQSFGGAERWAPESRACTLELDGDEQGIYFLVERVKRDDDRIQIGSGGRILKLDDSGGIADFSAVGHGTWALPYPSDPTDQDVASAQAMVTEWVRAIQSDPTAIGDVVDLDSAIDFVLLQELTKNNDAFYLSVHIWQDEAGPAHFAPWDLDLTLGQPTYNNNVSAEEWVLYRPKWVAAFGDVPGFDQRLSARWFELRDGPLADDAVMARLEAQLATVQPAVEDNFDIWAWDDIDFLDGTLPVVRDHDAELDKIRAWIPERLTWIDANIDHW